MVTKIHVVIAMVLPVVMYGCWELDHKEGRVLKNWCFSTMVLDKTFESPMDSKEMKPSLLEEINPEYSLEGLMLKLQYFGHLMQRADSLEENGATVDEIVGSHHWLNGHESEQTPGDSEGQGRLEHCSPWGHRVGHSWETGEQEISEVSFIKPKYNKRLYLI